ncbi:MAG: MGMT family protein [Candidatus Lambdaproteobacteria bacterium]|nr:MGMT family protein [Candidatus Lambdaproteobacteria bacterium]
MIPARRRSRSRQRPPSLLPPPSPRAADAGPFPPARPDPRTLPARVYALVARIPPGRVATYGQLGELAGFARRARFVGQALANTPPGLRIPWHRVVNAQGRISPRSGEAERSGARGRARGRRGETVERLQQRLLEAEGVTFVHGRLDLARYRWYPVVDESWGQTVHDEAARGEAP